MMTLEGGWCQCPEGYLINDAGNCEVCTNCTNCDTLGCGTCSSENTAECIACLDWYWTEIVDGECVCTWSSSERVNSEGVCEYCYVDGCASCLAGDSYTCFQCEDSSATIENGECVCPEGSVMLDSGVCCSDC